MPSFMFEDIAALDNLVWGHPNGKIIINFLFRAPIAPH